MASEHEGEKVATVSRPRQHPIDAAARSGSEAAVMSRNGITCIPANHYQVDGFRYTNLADALAQVSRGGPRREARR